MLRFAESEAEAVGMADWAEARIEHLGGGNFGPAVFGEVTRGGSRAAVVAFYDWREGYDTLGVSVALSGRRWASPGVVRAIFHYAFAQAGANLLQVGTPASNRAGVRFVRRVGFRQEAVLRDRYGPGRDMVIFSLTAAEWRQSSWFKEMCH